MSNTAAINHESVQQIIDRNSAERKRKEAALEAQARKLRLIINDNHTAKTSVKTADKAPERPQEEPEAIEDEVYTDLPIYTEERTQRRQEREYCTAWLRFLALVFAPLILSALLFTLAGTAPIAIVLLISMAAYTILIIATAIKAFFPRAN